MAFTFKGTYTQNRGDAVAAGTVDIISKRGVTLDTATLDENGSYELEIDAEEGEVTVVETLDGVPARSYPVSVSRGSTTDTSRDIGYVGPGGQSGASVLAGVLGLSAGASGLEDNIVLAAFQEEGVYKSLGYGPVTIQAGETFTVFVGAPTASDLSIDTFSLAVSNAAGTEKLRLILTAPALAENGGYWAPVGADWTQHLLVGSDLTALSAAPADGGIQSAAGGQFFVTIDAQFGLTAP